MIVSVGYWQVWIKNYNPSFYTLLTECKTRAEAEQIVREYDANFWDQENGVCGLEAVKVSKPLFDI